jgi:hypothetical protein
MLAGSTGEDRYTNTALYSDLLREASASGAGKSFSTAFPVEAWINPNDPTAVQLFGTNPSYPGEPETDAESKARQALMDLANEED